MVSKDENILDTAKLLITWVKLGVGKVLGAVNLLSSRQSTRRTAFLHGNWDQGADLRGLGRSDDIVAQPTVMKPGIQGQLDAPHWRLEGGSVFGQFDIHLDQVCLAQGHVFVC